MSIFASPQVLEHKQLKFETSPSYIGGSVNIYNPGGNDVKVYSNTQPNPATDGYPGDPVYGPYKDSGGVYWWIDVPPSDTIG